MSEMKNPVVLPLTPEKAKQFGATHAAYPGSNVKSTSLSRLRRQMMLFCAEAFGENGEKT